MEPSADPAVGVDPINLIDPKSKLLLLRAGLWAEFDSAGARDKPALYKAIIDADARLAAFTDGEKVSSHDEVAAARAARRAAAAS